MSIWLEWGPCTIAVVYIVVYVKDTTSPIVLLLICDPELQWITELFSQQPIKQSFSSYHMHSIHKDIDILKYKLSIMQNDCAWGDLEIRNTCQICIQQVFYSVERQYIHIPYQFAELHTLYRSSWRWILIWSVTRYDIW